MIQKTVIFLALNFLALFVGGVLMGGEVTGSWYAELNKAPWTPPGWVFGAAWTTIMVCFSMYMALLVNRSSEKSMLYREYGAQWILNVCWNPLFFYLHWVNFGLLWIALLTVLVWYFLIRYRSILKWWSLLIVPYAIWMVIATSLNAYVVFMN